MADRSSHLEVNALPQSRTFLRSLSSLVLLAAGLCLTAVSTFAQSRSDGARKQMRAVRVEGVPSPRLDGRLDDPAWGNAEFVSDFLQKEPNEGAVPAESTGVAVMYDDNAVYIAARMYSDHPEAIRTDVNRRDNPGNAEMIILSLDTYFDRRTSYDFCVTSSGVRMDRYHAADEEHETDYSYDVVWEGRAQIDSLGWTAEMRIPYSQLRFSREEVQTWGINWNRWIPARREDDFWIYTPRDETGWASRFGDLVGIERVKPSSRLELLPYFAGDGRSVERDAADPFKENPTAHVGGDLKMGLGPNLTIDGTMNPDFGQVEADPAEVNLSAFETSFSERRPFFTEGSHLFEADGPAYYYSRRIGASPHGDARGDYVDYPHNTTIPAAAKISGRLNSGLSIGGLLAVTGREWAKAFDSETKTTSKVKVEPPTGYGVMRLQQEFGEDASTVGIILTGVGRDLAHGEPLADQLRRKAYSGGADWNLRFNGGAYELTGYAGFSHIRGDTAAILKAQLSSARYFQRPDVDYVALDPARTSLTGYTGSLNLEKKSGRHWLWETGFDIESPEFEINDIGILNTADDIDHWAVIRYRENTPGPILRGYSFAVSENTGWNYGGSRQYTNLELDASTTWNNYWSMSAWFENDLRSQSDNFTRGGPTMSTSASFSTGASLYNNFSAATRYGTDFWYARNELGGWGFAVNGSFSTRGTRWQVGVDPGYERSETSRQYVATVAGGGAQTYGKRYVFSGVDRSTLSAQFRVNYFFTPDLSLEVYAEPFAASGDFFGFGELVAAGGNELRRYGTDGTTIEESDGAFTVTDGSDSFTFHSADFNALEFNSNMVLRWEFRPGSTMYLIWQQRREGSGDPSLLVHPRSLSDAVSAPGENFFALKFSYWIPVS